jgi:hypothetical protein
LPGTPCGGGTVSWTSGGAWFESWLTLEVRGRRPRATAFCERELDRFAAHVDTPPLLVTKTIVRGWLKDLIDSGLSAYTVGNRMVVLKSFYSLRRQPKVRPVPILDDSVALTRNRPPTRRPRGGIVKTNR